LHHGRYRSRRTVVYVAVAVVAAVTAAVAVVLVVVMIAYHQVSMFKIK